MSASESSKLEDELKQLKALKMAASSDSPSDAFMGAFSPHINTT